MESKYKTTSMKLVLHHTAGRQNINKPEDIGGNWKFYNKIVTHDKVWDMHENPHPRGPFESYDVALTGDFRTDTPTEFQKQFLNSTKEPVLRHKDLKYYGATIGTLDTECPGNLMKIQVPTTVIGNGNLESIKKFSRDRIEIVVTKIDKLIQDDRLSTDEAFELAKGITTPILVIFYESNFGWAYTTFNNNTAICAIPNHFNPDSVAFEYSHALQNFYNAHRGTNPYVPVEDHYRPTDEIIYKKYDDIVPYLHLVMGGEELPNKTIVKARQLLEGFKDESGQEYWADKPERSYLIARIKDKIKDLTEVLAELQ